MWASCKDGLACNASLFLLSLLIMHILLYLITKLREISIVTSICIFIKDNEKEKEMMLILYTMHVRVAFNE